MSLDSSIADHYAASGLIGAIRTGVDAIGKTPTTVTVEDLAPVDEFHIGGRIATTELCEGLGVDGSSEVLDIGCGIGGASRFVAAAFGCGVTGIDLTPNYVAVANELTEWTGLEALIRFEVASALDMPFDDGSFDRAIQLHVGMNIPDKPALFEEVYRVLRPGARLAVYDIMQASDDSVSYPMPWATDPSTSFVAALSDYEEALVSAGFVITNVRDRAEFARGFFAALQARSAASAGPPPLGLHLTMGSEAPTKIANMIAGVSAGSIAPVEIICEKPNG